MRKQPEGVSFNLKNSIMKIRTFLNYEKTITNKERFEKESKQPSLTVEHQAESLATVVNKFINGQPLPIGKQVYYDNLDDFDGIDPTLDPNFDLADVSEFMQQHELKKLEQAEAVRVKAKEAKQREAAKAKTLAAAAEQAKTQSVTTEKDTPD